MYTYKKCYLLKFKLITKIKLCLNTSIIITVFIKNKQKTKIYFAKTRPLTMRFLKGGLSNK